MAKRDSMSETRNYSRFISSESSQEFDNQIVERLTEQEIAELDTEIEASFNGFKAPNDVVDFLKRKNALNEDGAVKISGYRYIKVKGEFEADCDPVVYERWQNRLRQWGFWKSRQVGVITVPNLSAELASKLKLFDKPNES